TDVAVVLHHAVRIDAQPGYTFRLFFQVRPDVHAGRVPPHEERLVIIDGLFDELDTGVEEFLIDRSHALDRERAGVRYFLRAICVSVGVQDTAWSELLLELGIFWIVRVLRLLLRVQVIEIPEELVEAVSGGHEFITVAEVILAELPTYIAER